MNLYYLNNFRKLTGLADDQIIRKIKELDLPYESILIYLIYYGHLPDSQTADWIRNIGIEMYFHLLKTGVSVQ